MVLVLIVVWWGDTIGELSCRVGARSRPMSRKRFRSAIAVLGQIPAVKTPGLK
ncbi:MAG TPA: hypothetical protein VK211_25435 [Kamptonema sp.]|nr:hypothetical protein [Kamptonema sp.]